MAKTHGVLVKVRGGSPALKSLQLGAAGDADVEMILEVPAGTSRNGNSLAAETGSTWVRLKAPGTSDNPWDEAHALLAQKQGFAANALAQNVIEAIEPDLEQRWLHGESPEEESPTAFAGKDRCTFNGQTDDGGRATGTPYAWNLDENYSALERARARVGDKQSRILVAHLDTGYDPAHATLPANLRRDWQRNFVDRDTPNDARDRTPPGREWMRNRGHGTATLALLAGAQVTDPPSWDAPTVTTGGAPLTQILPIRIADWVVRFHLGTMIQGIDYSRQKGAQVLSMSMGGVSSRALVDAVNVAYDAGLVMVTAAGNNFSGLPTPSSIVFPARLHRVLAACGVMADGRAYTGLAFRRMQGNYGPASKMPTALGAYTPNVPWAQIDCGKLIGMDGGGTSAATPQIAAAAALWLAEYWDEVSQYPETWMRVEAVRHALFASARKSTPRMDEAITRKTIGQGVCNALAALDVRPPAADTLRKLPPAEASWSWINLLFGHDGVSLVKSTPLERRRQEMLALELTQIAHLVRDVDDAIEDPERPASEIPAACRSRYLEAVLSSGQPSKPLRALLENLVGRTRVVPSPLLPKTSDVKRHTKRTEPPMRRLRVYALDPSLGKALDSRKVTETVLSVPWDDRPAYEESLSLSERRSTLERLEPGPVGEYLEVIDIDPASRKAYDPVDLNDPYLLAQDGLAPSEGNPQFHQQMVYAVAMATIGHFERALGRAALWAPDRDKNNNNNETRRLRIYPHALRGENAYYSPEKKALLFGYFPSRSSITDSTAPGSMVFTCLSSDIIAHEMTHALLDGLHRRFEEPSNPDVIAFHEAFADIVALFQHFMIRELVRFEIGNARGDLSAMTLLAGLAKEFGEGANRSGPLRNYVGPEVRGLVYEETTEPHARGSILVFAVYDAFISVVTQRTADLLRIATNGSGVLPAGALHPDLVDRLTTETCETAAYFLTMCIRALDYCPPVDITFGEYLRAIITADRDLVADDRHGYRVAIMEAFRKRGLLPYDVRTMSEETLSWGTFAEPRPKWLDEVIDAVQIPWNGVLSRSEIFELNEDNRRALWHKLDEIFAEHPEALPEFGLMPCLPRYNNDGTLEIDRTQVPRCQTTFEVHNVRPARRIAPDGTFRIEIIAVITQRRPIAHDCNDKSKGFFWFRGGATLVIDPREGRPAREVDGALRPERPGPREIRYAIIKNSASDNRVKRQRAMAQANTLTPQRSLYFGNDIRSEPFALIHADREDSHG